MRDTENLRWDKIIDYIKEQKAVLLIGPEIIQLNGQSLYLSLRDKIFDDYQDSIPFYYKQDGLFSFTDAQTKADVALDNKKYLEKFAYEEALLKKIAQIPFHLIISVNTDTYLSDVFYKYGIRHRFNYFRKHANDTLKEQEKFREVEEPTVETPLIYNLFGCKNDEESLILDYDDLFNLIAASVGSIGLPEKLSVSLRKVRTFFLIGFDFEKWYTQLLLRLLSGEKQYDKYATNSPIKAGDMQDFIKNQFKIEFLNKDQNFIDVLYEKCQCDNILRQLADPIMDKNISVVRHVQNAAYEQALEVLKKLADGKSEYNDIIQLQGQYNKIRDERHKDLIDVKDALREYNRIADAILTYLSLIK